jgi:hypothetical protein
MKNNTGLLGALIAALFAGPKPQSKSATVALDRRVSLLMAPPPSLGMPMHHRTQRGWRKAAAHRRYAELSRRQRANRRVVV